MRLFRSANVALYVYTHAVCSIDCVGILKLRNVDVERRVGATRSRKKSNRVRMVCRVLVPLDDGSSTMQMLQTVSTPICCCELIGAYDMYPLSTVGIVLYCSNCLASELLPC